MTTILYSFGRTVSSVLRPIALANACTLALLVGGLAPGHAAAQNAAGANVLKGADVTEKNLLDALTPPTDEVRTRSIRMQPSAPGTVAPAAARKPNASLLITFETNSSELTAAAKQQLDIVGAALKNDRLASYNFVVEGHADPRTTHGVTHGVRS